MTLKIYFKNLFFFLIRNFVYRVENETLVNFLWDLSIYDVKRGLTHHFAKGRR